MNKLDLVEAVYSIHGGISRREASGLVDVVLAGVKSGLRRRGWVHITGFGSFDVVRRMARTGRNPRTGEKMEIPSCRSLVFRPSRLLLALLNHGEGSPEDTRSP